MSTNSLSAKAIKREWHMIDANNKVLGRLASEVATILSGKNKAQYVPYLDCGDHVVIINAAKIKVSGRKESDKKYYQHSGFPGGLRSQTLSTVRQTSPESLIIHAVKGMVPNNKLGSGMLKKLHVFAGTSHPFKKQLNSKEEEHAE